MRVNNVPKDIFRHFVFYIEILSSMGVKSHILIWMIIIIIATTKANTDWEQLASDELLEAIKTTQNNGIAKNIILFVGDGMGISTVTAGRIYRGQKNGNPGEETILHFEKFPHIALSKVYGTDRQVPDSAQTATAFLSGVKTNWEVVGLKDTVKIRNCSSQQEPDMKVKSILKHAQTAGKATGVVTTTRITHATPAAAYAYAASRNWESDADMNEVTGGCTDIAHQLVYDNKDIQVILGGGRRCFLPMSKVDPETGTFGKNERLDDVDLTEVWQTIQNSLGRKYKYVWNKGQFDAVVPEDNTYLFGLFNPSHMDYEINRDKTSLGEPSLAEMTSKAIKILKKNSEGFFLLVEGGRIDHAHHDSTAKKSLEEVLTLEDAVREADKLTDDEDTLIIVTADHSHPFTLTGYTYRGNDILGLVDPLQDEKTLDNLPYTTLSYANGPGYQYGTRANLTGVNTGDNNYIQASAVPTIYETHSGEDVAIYAKGPMSHLFHSVHEQNYIAHVMQYSACIGRYSVKCRKTNSLNGSYRTIIDRYLILFCLTIYTRYVFK